ncbi:abortive infection family protein [Brachybacterium sp. GCM10030267]|uniref:abortive infection family protein n=1 Tax=Brachybacterium sp. GCM10030267 TaxID=3273381 RepID=UPI003620754A
MMPPPWTNEVAHALRRLMERAMYPSHAGLDDIFARRHIDVPEIDVQGERMSKVRRLRAAFEQADAQGEDAVKWLVADVIDEMRFHDVFSHPGEERLELVERLRAALASAGAILDADGRIQRGYAGPEISAGGRETVDRLQGKLRKGDLDPGSILGTSKDLLEATAKHLLHEHEPEARPADMPGIVTQAMRAAGLTTNANEIDSPNAKAIAGLRGQVVKTAAAVAPLRNNGGDGHGHLEPTDVSPELAEYIKNLTLAAVAYLLSSVDGRPGAS